MMTVILIYVFLKEYLYKLFKNCNYYCGDSFNIYLVKHAMSNYPFSVEHLNVRSIPTNLSAFQPYMGSLDHYFTVNGVFIENMVI